MNKDSLKNTSNNNLLPFASSYSQSKLQSSKLQTPNSAASLAFSTGLSSPKESSKMKVTRLETQPGPELIIGDHSNVLASSKEIENLRKVTQSRGLSDLKISGTISPSNKHSTLGTFGSSLSLKRGLQNDKQSLGKDTDIIYNFKKDRFPAANELRVMDDVMEKFKKLSLEQQTISDPNSYQRLATERTIRSDEKKGRKEISTYLKQPGTEPKKIVFRTEPLNGLIHKKLGLDPITKQRIENCFVSVVETDFYKRVGLPRDINPTFRGPKDEVLKYQKILPHDILASRANLDALESIPKPTCHQMNDLIDQAQENSGFFTNCELDCSQLPQSRNSGSHKERANYTTELDSFSAIDLNTEVIQDGGNSSVKTLSLFELEIKEEMAPKSGEVGIRNGGQDIKFFKGQEIASKVDNRFTQDAHNPSASDELEWNQDIIGAGSKIKEGLPFKSYLVQENNRLNDEVQKLRAKLKLYEQTRSKP